MPRFKVEGKGKETGRKRSRTYKARDADQAKALAAADGTEVESIVELPPEPPSEAQIEYARDLGILIPNDVSGIDLSHLISNKVEGDPPASPQERAMAEELGLEVSPYIGQRRLFANISSVMTNTDRREDMVGWYLFCLTLARPHRDPSKRFTTPRHPAIVSIAETLATDDQLVTSIRNELRNKSMRDYEPNQSYAYKRSMAALENFTSRKPADTPPRRQKGQKKENKSGEKASGIGCLIVAAIIIYLIFLAFF
ncbi:hypothetical protein M911_14005 [Ectothiorhodospira haloalkaliphila]|uniref:Uncharacterized protein n=1 Tax=Ectothiorhodospira haloalkaliphila TaxID=421628 RepID=W8KYZ6_9GAMM|nr:hypothetical protein [Ectothiorhodospira haloalkaliphila]AHK80776.1 hypothetical protein M911_14005 [Ectothiorhodospira haloalkaliphila]